MRFIDSLCPPALLYLLFVTIQVALDLSLGLVGIAAVKGGFGLAGTYILNTLCSVELGAVSWAIVVTPFLITAAGVAIALGLSIQPMLNATEKFDEMSPQAEGETDDVVVTMSQEAPPAEEVPVEEEAPPMEEEGGEVQPADSYPFSTNSVF